MLAESGALGPAELDVNLERDQERCEFHDCSNVGRHRNVEGQRSVY